MNNYVVPGNLQHAYTSVAWGFLLLKTFFIQNRVTQVRLQQVSPDRHILLVLWDGV
jgi:hypothetical protein